MYKFSRKILLYEKYNIQAAFQYGIVRPREAVYFAIDLTRP